MLLAGVVLLGGCAVSKEVRLAADQVAAEAPATELSCPQDDPHRCAVDSELRVWADGAMDSGRHFVRLLEQGERAYHARIHLIRAARRSIDIQSFIFHNDTVGRHLMEELLIAARRGVRVRLLFDQLYSGNDLDFLARAGLSHENLTLRLYNPTFNESDTSNVDFFAGILCCFFDFNERMHNKLMVVDQRVGITGGRNLSDRYFDFDPHYSFRDRDLLLIGPEVQAMQASFDLFWDSDRSVPLHRLDDVSEYLAAGQLGQLPEYHMPQRLAASLNPLRQAQAMDWLHEGLEAVADVRFYSDHPLTPGVEEVFGREDITAILRREIASAQQSVLVQSPYMILSNGAESIFRHLRETRPDLRVRVSTNSLASIDGFPAYGYLHKKKRVFVMDLGLEIYEFRPFPRDTGFYIPRHPLLIEEKAAGIYSVPPDEMLPDPTVGGNGPRLGVHAKSLVIDSRLSMIGSHNFDPRSESLNTECGVLIRDAAFAKRLERLLMRDMDPGNSWVLSPTPELPVLSRLNGFFERLFIALPTLDVWPFQRISAYQLRDGGSPVPLRHPDFYEEYESLGSFPGVEMTSREIQASLFSVLFGFLEPIL